MSLKQKNIVFETKNMLMNELKLKSYVNDVTVEQVQEASGIIVESKLLWSKHTDKNDK